MCQAVLWPCSVVYPPSPLRTRALKRTAPPSMTSCCGMICLTATSIAAKMPWNPLNSVYLCVGHSSTQHAQHKTRHFRSTCGVQQSRLRLTGLLHQGFAAHKHSVTAGDCVRLQPAPMRLIRNPTRACKNQWGRQLTVFCLWHSGVLS